MGNYAIAIDVVILLLMYGVFAYLKLLPETESLQNFANLLNSKGGNILVLLALSMLFFATGVRMTYWCLERTIEGKLKADDAVMMMGLTFITGSCFGGAFSSMLKVMSGETPTPPANTTVETSTVVKSETPQPSSQTTITETKNQGV